MRTTDTFRRRGGTRRRVVTGGLVLAGLLAAGSATAGPAAASSHREAPGVAGTPRVDTTDLYAFLSPDKPGTVTLLANVLPFSEPSGGPDFFTFDDDALYDIAVDTNGDAKPDVVYRWDFATKVRNGRSFLYTTGPVRSLTDRNLNVVQTYDLLEFRHGRWTTLRRHAIAAPSNVGKASMPDYGALRRQATGSAGAKDVFAGQADDPFFADLRVFDLLYGGDLSEIGNDTLAGYDVNTIAIRVPVSELGGAKNVIGVWSRTLKKNARGSYRQVSRLGNPLVNEVVNPLKDKDTFNASEPEDDARFLQNVLTPELPKVVEQVLKVKAPAEPRKDLVQVFLTGVPGLNQLAKVTPSEQLRLNLTPFKGQTANRLGVIGGDKNGFPNGRRLGDDTIDIALQVMEGELVGSPNDLGDKVDGNDVRFERSFPYIGLPTSGSDSVDLGAGGSKDRGGEKSDGGEKTPDEPTADDADSASPASNGSRASIALVAGGGASNTSLPGGSAVAAMAGFVGVWSLGTGGVWLLRRRRVSPWRY